MVGTLVLTGCHGAVLIVTVKLMTVTVGRLARYTTARARRKQRIMMIPMFKMVVVRSALDVHAGVVAKSAIFRRRMTGDVVFAALLLGHCSSAMA